VSAIESTHTAQSSELTTTSSERAQSPVDIEGFDNVACFCLEKVLLFSVNNLSSYNLRQLFGGYCVAVLIGHSTDISHPSVCLSCMDS